MSPKQVLLLWNLLFTGNQPAITELRPKLSRAEWKAMEKDGLIEPQRRGRRIHICLTPKALDWAAENMDAEISQSQYAAEALSALLGKLKIYLRETKSSLPEFIKQAAAAEPESRPMKSDPPDLADQVRQAYLTVSGGLLNVRVRLAQLISYLSDVPKPVLDELLVAMQRVGRFGLVLWSLDDPRDITAADDQAAVSIAGIKRHIIYMES
ncbi:MAG: hypothetical protein HQK55_04065 [Deltaproteobacteria bacterium]|nr:hypothetical protein [Deltaproteobacteria bacterium]